MNDEELTGKLFARARLEQPPEVDIIPRVMAAVRARTREETPVPFRPMAWVAAFSGATAVVVMMAAAEGLELFQDPLSALMLDLMWVIL